MRLFVALCFAAVIPLGSFVGCVANRTVDTSAMSFTSEPLVGKVIWNDLITEDIEAARHFYGELFGWAFDRSTTPDGNTYLLARSGKTYVGGIVELRSHPANTTESRWLPYVSVSDVDVSVDTATDAGATVAVPARDLNMGRVAVIIDREGAVIGLARSDIGDPDDTTTAPAAGRVVWTELLANDPATAAQFYEAVVGWIARTAARSQSQYIFLSHENRDRAGILKNPSDSASPVWLTYFGVDDPAAAASRVETLGGHVILWPSAQLRNGTMAVVTDPTGALLVLRKVGA